MPRSNIQRELLKHIGREREWRTLRAPKRYWTSVIAVTLAYLVTFVLLGWGGLSLRTTVLASAILGIACLALGIPFIWNHWVRQWYLDKYLITLDLAKSIAETRVQELLKIDSHYGVHDLEYYRENIEFAVWPSARKPETESTAERTTFRITFDSSVTARDLTSLIAFVHKRVRDKGGEGIRVLSKTEGRV